MVKKKIPKTTTTTTTSDDKVELIDEEVEEVPPPQHFDHDIIKKEKEESENYKKKKVKKTTISNNGNKTTTTTTTTKKPLKKSNNCGCKFLDPKTHSFCSRVCGCSNNELRCSISCACKGLCSNGKSISDDLFFKVWRNIYIRDRITGDKRLEILRIKNQFKNELIEKLVNYKIKYNEIDLNLYSNLYGNKENRETNLEYVFQKYLNFEKENRFNQFKKQFIIYNKKIDDSMVTNPNSNSNSNSNSNINLFRGKLSDVINRYSNAVTPEEQSKLPWLTIHESIIEEINEIEKIKDKLKLWFQGSGIEFNTQSKNIESFIIKSKFSKMSDFSISLLVGNERLNQSEIKKNKIISTLKKIGIHSIHYKQEVEDYSKTFKQDEIISKNVWSFDEIIQAEKEYKNYMIEKRNRKNLIINSLNSNNIIYRPKSEIIIKFINNVKPPIPPTSTTSTTSATIDNEPTIEQILEFEKQSIESLKNNISQVYIEEGLKFNEMSIDFIDFIKATGGGSSNDNDSIDQLLKSLSEKEIQIQKEEKKQQIKNLRKETSTIGYGSPFNLFYNEEQNYINTFKPNEIIEKNVLSFQELVKKQLQVKEKFKLLIDQLNENNIKEWDLYSFIYSSKQVREYLKWSPSDERKVKANGEIDKDNIPTLEKAVQHVIGVVDRSNLLKSRLDQVGLFRKNILYDIYEDYSDEYQDKYLKEFLKGDSSNFTIDEIIVNEIFRWRLDSSEDAIQSRIDYINEEIENSNYQIISDLYDDNIIENPFIDKFINGKLPESEWKQNSLQQIAEYQIEFTLEHLENLTPVDPYSDLDSSSGDEFDWLRLLIK